MTASKQASKHTHAYAQCSHASVVLAQAHPGHPLINLRWYTTQGWTLLYFMIVNKYIPRKVRLNNDWVSDDQWLSRWRCSVSNLTQVYWREVIPTLRLLKNAVQGWNGKCHVPRSSLGRYCIPRSSVGRCCVLRSSLWKCCFFWTSLFPALIFSWTHS